jgi:hypothetical protein
MNPSLHLRFLQFINYDTWEDFIFEGEGHGELKVVTLLLLTHFNLSIL